MVRHNIKWELDTSLPLAAVLILPEQLKQSSVLLLLLQSNHRPQHVGEVAFWRGLPLPLLTLCTWALKLGRGTCLLIRIAGSCACSILQKAEHISATESFWDRLLPGRLLGHCRTLRLPPPARSSAQRVTASFVDHLRVAN